MDAGAEGDRPALLRHRAAVQLVVAAVEGAHAAEAARERANNAAAAASAAAGLLAAARAVRYVSLCVCHVRGSGRLDAVLPLPAAAGGAPLRSRALPRQTKGSCHPGMPSQTGTSSQYLRRCVCRIRRCVNAGLGVPHA